MTVLRLMIFGITLMVVATAVMIIGSPNSTADAHFTPTTTGTNLEQLCEEPTLNLVSVAGLSWVSDSELMPPLHHNSYMPPPKCWKVRTSCAKWYTYTDCDRDGNCKTKRSCDKWNYKWKCSR